MARSRSFPVSLLDDPDYFEQSSDTQAILIGLILTADDEGRGLAHIDWLSRKFNKPEGTIETALAVLSESGLLQVYHVEKRRYYQLLRWNEWQTLYKPRRSTFPPPPLTSAPEPASQEAGSVRPLEENLPASQEANFSQKKQTFLGKEKRNMPEEEAEEEKEEEGEAEGDMRHAFPSPSAPLRSKVLPFPGTSPNADDADESRAMNSSSPPGTEPSALVQQIAQFLRLPVTDALTRLVLEYAAVLGLSLPSEADAAREWIDDSRRNRQRKRMSVSFFRNWLKREQDAIARRQIALQQAAQATGTSGPGSSPPHGDALAASRRPPNLMHLADEDRHAKQPKGDRR